MRHSLRRVCFALLILFGVQVRAERPAQGVDRGIYPELSTAVEAQLTEAPVDTVAGEATLRIDARRGLATLYVGPDPRKLYRYPLDAATRRELDRAAPTRHEEAHPPSRSEDHDEDGVVE